MNSIVTEPGQTYHHEAGMPVHFSGRQEFLRVFAPALTWNRRCDKSGEIWLKLSDVNLTRFVIAIYSTKGY